MAGPKSTHAFALHQWVELLLGAAALLVSAVSLWVAIGTEQANREMVAAASWPLLQVDSADIPENGRGMISMSIINGGVGPAKLKTLQVWWHGKAYAGARPLLKDCCGYRAFDRPAEIRSREPAPVLTGGVHDVVIRAGERHNFLRMPLGAENVDAWRKLDRARHELKYRACYCSVFDECWVGTLIDLEPHRVDTCPAVKVPYIE